MLSSSIFPKVNIYSMEFQPHQGGIHLIKKFLILKEILSSISFDEVYN